MDKRPGLTFLKYKPPVNFTQPDSVTIVNATTVDFNVPSMQGAKTESALGGQMIARLLGFLRLPINIWDSKMEHLKICVSYNSATLHVSRSNNPQDAVIVEFLFFFRIMKLLFNKNKFMNNFIMVFLGIGCKFNSRFITMYSNENTWRSFRVNCISSRKIFNRF